jgi:hypothetical protein
MSKAARKGKRREGEDRTNRTTSRERELRRPPRGVNGNAPTCQLAALERTVRG